MTLNLVLTAAQRKLLCESLVIPGNYLDRSSPLTTPHGIQSRRPWRTSWDFVAAEANHATSRKRQKALGVVFEKMQRLLEDAAERQ